MKKLLILSILLAAPLAADEGGGGGPTIGNTRPPARVQLMSTSVDWEAVTGFMLHEFQINFTNTQVAGTGRMGWEMYYLDEFPCYGGSWHVKVWLNQRIRSPRDRDSFFRIMCIMPPSQIRIAYRETQRDSFQDRTTGILTCPVNSNQVVDLAECERQTWQEFARDYELRPRFGNRLGRPN